MGGSIAGIIIGVILIVGGVVAVARHKKTKYDNDGRYLKYGGIVVIVIGLVIAGWSAFWLFGTEAGARAQKTWSSETGGGLTRVVKIYDMQGELIQSYTGQFDIDYDDERVLFDIPQEDGSYKRVQVWSKTGTVITEELPDNSGMELPK